MTGQIYMGVDLATKEDVMCLAVRSDVGLAIVHQEIAKLILSGQEIDVLTIKQPWAWLIVQGYKPVENREWKTQKRGPLLIHASKEVDRAGYEWVRQNLPEIFGKIPPPWQIEKGGIVGAAMLTDCVTKHISIWFFGKYGFVLDNPTPLPFYPMKGQLGFFKAKYKGGQLA